MDEFNFIEVPNTSSKVIDTITLTSNDYLSFPTFFTQKHKIKDIGEDLHVRLFYDKAKQAVAIQFVPSKEPGLYRVNVSPEYGATCKIKSFLLSNDIDTKKYANKYEYSKYSASELGLADGNPVYVIRLGAKVSQGGLQM